MYSLIKKSISTIALSTLAITSLPTYSVSSQTTEEYGARKYFINNNIENIKNIENKSFDLIQNLNTKILEKENIETLSGTVVDFTKEATSNSTIPNGLIIEKSNINITAGKGYDLSSEMGSEYVKALEKGTIIVSYKSTSNNSIQSLVSIGNNTSGNRDRHFHIYITNTGEVGMELRNTDSVLKYTLGRPAAVRSIYKNNLVFNTIAFKADPSNKQYKLFANGELLATLNTDVYKFINDITGVNNVMLGGTVRDGVIAYHLEEQLEM